MNAARHDPSHYTEGEGVGGLSFLCTTVRVAKIRNISEIHNEKDSFLLIFDNMTFHNRCYKVIAPVTFPHSAYYIIGRKDYLAVPDKSPFEIHKKVRIQLNNS
jgi:hypothetical protein